MTDHKPFSVVKEELANGSLTCVSMVEDFLKRIEENSHLNAFLEVFAHDARSRASVIDAKYKRGTQGKLAGMIIAIKDNIVYKGHVSTAASKILNGFESLFTATAIERLIEEDAIIIGRTNCDEFAMGSANTYSAYGSVKNPHNQSKVPGGSSGGSAAAMAAGLCHAALGSDTGGSIRQPASFTGTVGFKPSYGRISRYGLIAYASSFDQIGPFTTSVEDAALLYELMSGADAKDATASRREVSPVDFSNKEEKKRFAYFKETLDNPKLDEEVKAQTLDLIEKLKGEGHTVEAVEFPELEYLVPVYYILTTAEASSNLARFDGVHYGYRSDGAQDLEEIYKKSRTEGFGLEVKRRILLGTFVLSSGYYEAYYGKAQKARNLVRTKTNEIFKNFDFILSPTTPSTAFNIDTEVKDPTVMYLEDIFTVHANICGLPSISLPLGKHSNGMPFGVQLTAPAFADAALLETSAGVMNNF